jgi:hypothetical protein
VLKASPVDGRHRFSPFARTALALHYGHTTIVRP